MPGSVQAEFNEHVSWCEGKMNAMLGSTALRLRFRIDAGHSGARGGGTTLRAGIKFSHKWNAPGLKLNTAPAPRTTAEVRAMWEGCLERVQDKGPAGLELRRRAYEAVLAAVPVDDEERGEFQHHLKLAIEHIFDRPRNYMADNLAAQLAGTSTSRVLGPRTMSTPPAAGRSRSRSRSGLPEGRRSVSAGASRAAAQAAKPGDPRPSQQAPRDKRKPSGSRPGCRSVGATPQKEGKRDRKRQFTQQADPLLRVMRAQRKHGSIKLKDIIKHIMTNAEYDVQHEGVDMSGAHLFDFIEKNYHAVFTGADPDEKKMAEVATAIAEGLVLPQSREDEAEAGVVESPPPHRPPPLPAPGPVARIADVQPPQTPGSALCPASPPAAAADAAPRSSPLGSPEPSTCGDSSEDRIIVERMLEREARLHEICYSTPPPSGSEYRAVPNEVPPRRGLSWGGEFLLRVHLTKRRTMNIRVFRKVHPKLSEHDLMRLWRRQPTATFSSASTLPHIREMSRFKWDCEEQELLLKHEFERRYTDGYQRWKWAPEATDRRAELTLREYYETRDGAQSPSESWSDTTGLAEATRQAMEAEGWVYDSEVGDEEEGDAEEAAEEGSQATAAAAATATTAAS
eukprot:TRINITY_DN21474_c0_g1_i2.p1 TRINITY_DN21474_c0_g1~~TRINITY_DN21474_c0_g1_i2.p1  ORF type:complete len:624 (+),score=139.50 TRINITY_DN21474_c0_g1_i2:89-1960(+)